MATKVCALSDLEHGKARKFDVNGWAVAIVRIDDSVYAISDRCSHADVPLSDGEVYCDTKEIECIRHGSAFSLETGIPQTLPATQPVPVFVARVVDGTVEIDMEVAS